VARSGTWLAACSTEAFLDEVCALFSADRAQVTAAAAAFGGDAWAAVGAADAADPVCGRYAAYSWAWSPYRRGQLIRGLLRIAPGKRGRLDAVYSEALPNGVLEFRGEAAREGQVMHVDVGVGRDPSAGCERLSCRCWCPGGRPTCCAATCRASR
jgi:hypothetical protein